MAEQEEEIMWPGGFPEAKTIDEFDYLMTGKNGGPITKIPKSRLAEVIVINGEGVKAVAGGATSAAPTILRPGPTGANRKMEDVEGWFVNGTAAEPPVANGTAWEAPAGKKNTNWWDGTIWSLGSSVPLPNGKDGQGLLPLWDSSKVGGYLKDAQVRDTDGIAYVSLKDGNTSALSVAADWKSLGVKLDTQGGALSYEKGLLIEDNKADVSYVGNMNLFDNSKYVNDKFFAYTDVGNPYVGIATDAPGWFISLKIPAQVGKRYIKNNCAIGFFDSADIMIAAYPNSTENSIVAPTGTVAIRITAQKVSLNTIMLVEGSTIPGYESGRKKVQSENLPTEFLNRWKNTVIVSKFGGRFQTINEALSFLNGKDDFINRWIILLMPGSYVESVNLIGRYISIFGYDKESTIIRTYTNDYYNPPLDCGGNNNVSNVTVIADDDGNTTPPGGVGGMPAYAIHFDTSGRYENLGSRIQGRAVFENVRFISHHQHAAGIGLSQSQHLHLERCEFYSYSSPAFRAHNYLPAGATDQKMTVLDCQMHNKYGTDMWPIMLQDPNSAVGGKDNVDTIFQFIRNTAWYDDNDSSDLLYTHTPLVPGAITGKILLGRGSFGNNIPLLNK